MLRRFGRVRALDGEDHRHAVFRNEHGQLSRRGQDRRQAPRHRAVRGRRRGAQKARLRRHLQRRQGGVQHAQARRAIACETGGEAHGRMGRQGHRLRHGRSVHQVETGHVHDETRLWRCGRRAGRLLRCRQIGKRSDPNDPTQTRHDTVSIELFVLACFRASRTICTPFCVWPKMPSVLTLTGLHDTQ